MDLHKAILNIYSNVDTILGDNQSNIIAKDENGNQIEIDWSSVNSWVDPDQYKIDRASEYPNIAEQLDKLYHDINNGTLTTSGDFYSAINAVKTKYPKPSE